MSLARGACAQPYFAPSPRTRLRLKAPSFVPYSLPFSRARLRKIMRTAGGPSAVLESADVLVQTSADLEYVHRLLVFGGVPASSVLAPAALAGTGASALLSDANNAVVSSALFGDLCNTLWARDTAAFPVSPFVDVSTLGLDANGLAPASYAGRCETSCTNVDALIVFSRLRLAILCRLRTKTLRASLVPHTHTCRSVAEAGANLTECSRLMNGVLSNAGFHGGLIALRGAIASLTERRLVAYVFNSDTGIGNLTTLTGVNAKAILRALAAGAAPDASLIPAYNITSGVYSSACFCLKPR